MLEINTGVYVGKLNAKVREQIWERICGNIRSGQASMVYTCNNEQGYGFYTHNTTWKPIDYDGITLIKKYSFSDDTMEKNDSDTLKKGFSKASRQNYFSGRRKKVGADSEYVIVLSEQ